MTKSKEYEEGFSHFLAGFPIEDCFYKTGTQKAIDWCEGWNASYEEWLKASIDIEMY